MSGWLAAPAAPHSMEIRIIDGNNNIAARYWIKVVDSWLVGKVPGRQAGVSTVGSDTKRARQK